MHLLDEDQNAYDVPIKQVPSTQKPAPAWRRILFGFGFLGNGIQQAIMGFFQSTFFLEIAQIPPVWVGNIMIVKQVWDGAIDPFIGVLSDNIKTPLGRRKPWIFIFLWPAILLWMAMWAFPSFLNDATTSGLVAYYGIAVLLYSTFSSLVTVPYESMVPDMSDGYHSRTFVVLFMQVFLFIGTGVSSYSWSHLIEIFPRDEPEGTPHNYRRGFFIAAVVVAVPIVLSIFISACAAKERKLEPEEQTTVKSKSKCHSLARHFIGIKQVITFLPFFVILGFSISSLVAASIFTNSLILWIKYVYEQPKLVGTCLLILQGSIVCFLIVWAIVSRFIGKIGVYLVGSLFLLAGFGIMYYTDAGSPKWQLYLALILGGIGVASNYLIINSLLPDVVSMNEKITHIRREAVFYSLYGFVAKIAQGLAQMSTSYILGYYGYLAPRQLAALGPGATQNADVIEAFRVFVSLVPMGLRVIGMGFAIIYFFVARRTERRIARLDSKILDDNY